MKRINEQFNEVAIKHFWRWFESKEKWIGDSVLVDPEVHRQILTRLKRIHPTLTWEMDTRVIPLTGVIDRPITFTVSADGIRHAVPAAQHTVAVAPVMKHWKIQAFRQPSPTYNTITLAGKVFTMGDFSFTLDGSWGDATVTLFSRQQSCDKPTKTAGVLFVDALLGEYQATMGCGSIAVEGAGHRDITISQPLAALPAAFQALTN